MPEVIITRTQIIVVDEVGQNTYGDLTFTDKAGKEYKVSAKRKDRFGKVILPGMAVQLNYAVFMEREYIYSAALVKDKIPSPGSKETSGSGEPSRLMGLIKSASKSSPETGMWWKELGDMLRSGDIDKNTPQGKTIREAYYTEMLRVLGINIKEVSPAKSRLVEEAKKLGSAEKEVHNKD